MSLDITLNKNITLQEIIDKTTIKVEYKDDVHWLVKDGNVINVKTYTYSDEDIQKLISEGKNIEESNGENYLILNGEKYLLPKDKGLNNRIGRLTRYGVNKLKDILSEIVTTFQTKFITDEEEKMIYNEEDINVDNLFLDTTIYYGFNIKEDGVITVDDKNKIDY